ncbi:histidine triad nucleotide-binding protein [Anaerofustis stercorihominis]|uniref:histidine triad nucleotide-binding protein n=1 Tax=Anaerofustis stercorihominis TaxID=214853 RepID=UPI0026725EDA|nr:histidine triad nucleotide-binding protein [Anaerofustis stercorihominis]
MSDCLFCKIINGEIPSTKVYEDERVYAFKDVEPIAPYHVLVVPKKHYSSILDVENNDDIVSYVFSICVKLAKDEGFDEKGFRIINNCGDEGGQSVHHLHFHLLAGKKLSWEA